ncbi:MULTISPECIES: DUF4178 domain-containing protein [Bacillus cereus group]|uniref:DUF4178 domain-containing protein n=1 Tax=Bacillus cereus TaxID=1396 RepID=A0AA44TEH1_BACCE|nr:MULTISPECIES: DUF4178 domain-containing protein [Bacillus cereus group]EEL48832.1 hypothetical protein bcere0022_39210 [Bacillus cereus Rock3-44]PFA20764.1 DUF4178 domain-containing protein [Bacillus cereus]PFN04479.1 DUF4178 domain-containing protein [Bacillus cereus]PFO85601.1 DUF4178 domain-containing protein [Bacillus cereus]PFS01173.1 DUF4178 domain-containing protein [Bacillus cereus]
MSLFKRIKNIMKSPEPVKPEKSLLTLAPGDMVEVSLVMYELVGKTSMHSRNEIILTLQDGKTIRYLKIENRESTYYKLYTPIDGRLDSIEEIPTTIEMDDMDYHMEERYNGCVVVMGKTPFAVSDEQYVWEFQSDNRKLLRIEWQDGRTMMYEGESILPADVQIIRAT